MYSQLDKTRPYTRLMQILDKTSTYFCFDGDGWRLPLQPSGVLIVLTLLDWHSITHYKYGIYNAKVDKKVCLARRRHYLVL
jgi:hypothetical protein